MKKSKLFIGLACAAVVCGVATSCAALSEGSLTEYKTTFTDDIVTLDYLNTYHASDSENLVNVVDGLIEHDVYGVIVPALAESWSKSEDASGNDVYTFNLRHGAKWVTSKGVEYAEVKADDFVAGAQHVLDTVDEALGYILWGVIKNAEEYSSKDVTDFAQVGVKAVDEYTVQYTCEGHCPYFYKMVEYNPFMPINRAFFVSKGGAFGVDAWGSAAETCKFGSVSDIDSILYNGAFLFDEITSQNKIVMVKNEKYWDAEHTTLEKVTKSFTDGSNPAQTYKDFKKARLSGIGVSSTILDSVKKEHEDKLYVSETTSTTYYGTFNLNRQKYETGSVKSVKTDAQKADTKKAIANKNFRKAIQYAFSKESWNGSTVGEELALNAVRNTLTAPGFVSMPETFGGYAAGTAYEKVVEGELKKLDSKFTGTHSLDDSCDGWFEPAAAQAFMTAAKAELAGQVTFPIHLDIVAYLTSTNQQKQSTAFKQGIEAVLGTENVIIDIMDAQTTNDYYACGYRATTGADANFDFFYGSGWGPDYGDPLTYVSIFGYKADMMSVIGIGSGAGYSDDDKAAYDAALPGYTEQLELAKSKTGAERYVEFAKLEAMLLDSAVAQPTSTQGGNYAISRVQPKTMPNTLYGTDNEKFKHLVLHAEVLTSADVASYRATWATERAARMANPTQYYGQNYII